MSFLEDSSVLLPKDVAHEGQNPTLPSSLADGMTYAKPQ